MNVSSSFFFFLDLNQRKKKKRRTNIKKRHDYSWKRNAKQKRKVEKV